MSSTSTKLSLVKVFVYGTLKRGEYYDHVLEREQSAEFVEEDEIDGALYFDQLPFVTLEEDETVKGEVWEMSKEFVEERLDRFESAYERQRIRTRKGHDVWIYTQDDHDRDNLEPIEEYTM